MTLNSKQFGQHVRSLRKARGLTQVDLAERGGISADTIRRIEQGNMSPSLDTVQKLCVGVGLELSTFFAAAEVGERNEQQELIDLVTARSSREAALAARILRALFDELDAIAADKSS